MRRLMLVPLAIAACACPTAPVDECAITEVVDDGSLTQLHAFQEKHPWAYCPYITVNVSQGTVTYICYPCGDHRHDPYP